MAYLSGIPGADVYSRPSEQAISVPLGSSYTPFAYTTTNVLITTVGSLSLVLANGASVSFGSTLAAGTLIPVGSTAASGGATIVAMF